jgi:hypothetical protein
MAELDPETTVTAYEAPAPVEGNVVTFHHGMRLPTWDVSMPKPNAAGHPTLTIDASTPEEAVAAYLKKLNLSAGARPIVTKPSTPETK